MTVEAIDERREWVSIRGLLGKRWRLVGRQQELLEIAANKDAGHVKNVSADRVNFCVAHNLRPEQKQVNNYRGGHGGPPLQLPDQVCEEGFVCGAAGLDIVVELQTCSKFANEIRVPFTLRDRDHSSLPVACFAASERPEFFSSRVR